MNSAEIIEKLKAKGLKITPQRVIVFKSLCELRNHPSTEEIFERVKITLPNIAVGTVYNILETFVAKGLIEKINTQGDKMRYDIITKKHHHIFCVDTGKIIDYFDDELVTLIEDHLKKKHIPEFRISDVKLQISGEFSNSGKNSVNSDN